MIVYVAITEPSEATRGRPEIVPMYGVDGWPICSARTSPASRPTLLELIPYGLLYRIFTGHDVPPMTDETSCAAGASLQYQYSPSPNAGTLCPLVSNTCAGRTTMSYVPV